MKKITVVFMILVMLVSSCLVSASATETATNSLDSNLVVHFDFEGATLDEQLSDKSTGGQYVEKLTMNTTDEEVNGIKTEIKDGVAYVCENVGNYFKMDYTATTSDIPNATTGMTVYARIALKRNTAGTSTSFADYLYIQNILRAYAKNNSTTATTTVLQARMGEASKSAWAVKEFDENIDFVTMNGAEWIDIAYVYTYDPDTDTLTAYGYISFDGGKTYSVGNKWGYNEWTEVTEMFSNSTSMILGKNASNKDNDVAFLFDDVKIYNTNLTVEQLSQIVPVADNSGSTGGDDQTGDTTEDTTNDTTGDTTGGDETTNQTEAPTSAPEEPTEAPTTENETKANDTTAEGGCKSSVVGFSGLAVLLAGAWVTKKKK